MTTEPKKISALTDEQKINSRVALNGYKELIFFVEIDPDDETLISLNILSDDNTGYEISYLEVSTLSINNFTSVELMKTSMFVTSIGQEYVGQLQNINGVIHLYIAPVFGEFIGNVKAIITLRTYQ